MLDFRGFSAWITSEELELVEFEARMNEKTHIVTCWIAGPVGKTFIVHWRDHGSRVDSASYIYFDGYKVSGQFLYGVGEELRRGVRVGNEEERPFVFSSIEANDLNGMVGKPVDKNVGSIVLDIRLIKRVGEREPNPVRAPPNVVRGHRQEGDVCIRYGEVRPAAMQKRTWTMEPFDSKAPGPYVTFVFRYRSKDWLISQGIINDDDAISRVPMHPPTRTLSKVDLPPPSDDEGADVSDVIPIPDPAHSPPPTRSPPPPITALDGLHALGHGSRPQAASEETSRIPSNNSIRSFSGTWDPANANTGFEEWDEYRPDDDNDLNDAIENYY